MGPSPIKLEEELLRGHKIPENAVVCDLGSGQGLTSAFFVKEYGFTVYAADLWSDPAENRAFFDAMGIDRRCRGVEVLAVQEMERSEEVWADWLAQENEYAVGDRKSMEAGGGKYLNFIAIVLRKK